MFNMCNLGLWLFCILFGLAIVQVRHATAVKYGCGRLFERDVAYDRTVPSDEDLYIDTIAGLSIVRCCLNCHRERPNCAGVLYYKEKTICKLLKRNLNETQKADNVTRDGWEYFRIIPSSRDLAVDCRELHEKGECRSGVYQINPSRKPSNAITVYCDMVTAGGGWTAIQRRSNGSVDFNRLWNDYKFGFGIPEDYWIGNEAIHQLTKGRKSSLYVSITLQNDTTLYELYEQFYLTGETDKYRLIVNGSATGTLGDSLGKAPYSKMSAGQPFSTPDQDNDSVENAHCSADYEGGWWFNACFDTNLNRPWTSGMEWHPIIPFDTKVKETLMMIKPR